jgi:hypothetical protein
VLLDEAALVDDGALRQWHEGEHEREGGREGGALGVRRTCAEGRGGEGEGRGESESRGLPANKCGALPPFTGGCERRELARGKRWKKFVETPQNWISRRSLFCQGFATRIGGIAWPAIVGPPDNPSRVPLNFRSARSFARLAGRSAGRPAACRFTRKSAIC